MRNMSKEANEMRVVAAVISAILLSNDSEEAIKPSIGRGEGSSWSLSHRRMALGKIPLLKARSARSSKR